MLKDKLHLSEEKSTSMKFYLLELCHINENVIVYPFDLQKS